MSKSVIEVLTEARALVAKGWCQGPPAMNSSGRPTGTVCADACRWCCYGAISAVSDAESYYGARSAINAEAMRLGFVGDIHFNEHPGRTQAEVLDLFTKAIERAGEEAK